MASESLFRLFRIPYSNPSPGFWGEQTSTLNFCEEDYVISHYLAEFFNAITNAVFVWLGLWGLRNCLREHHSTIFTLSFATYFVVGLGSTAFHATMKFHMQLLDELSMIYATCLMTFAVLTHKMSKASQWILGIILASTLLGVTVYYYFTRDPAFHQAVYAFITLSTLGKIVHLILKDLRPALQTHTSNTREVDQTVRFIWTLLAKGAGLFLFGFALWNLDNEMCNMFISARRKLGLPWAIVLEGHAWWHIFTGFGAYYQIVCGMWLRYCLTGEFVNYEVEWIGSWLPIPAIVRKRVDTEKQAVGKLG